MSEDGSWGSQHPSTQAGVGSVPWNHHRPLTVFPGRRVEAIAIAHGRLSGDLGSQGSSHLLWGGCLYPSPHGHTGGQRLCGMAFAVHWGPLHCVCLTTNVGKQGLRERLHFPNLFLLASHNFSQLHPRSSSPQTDSTVPILWGSFKNQFDHKNQEAGLLGPIWTERSW